MALPEWEREGWRILFEVVGPLDWRREDFRDARRIQWKAVAAAPVADFVLFAEPGTTTEAASNVATTEEEAFALFDPGRRAAG